MKKLIGGGLAAALAGLMLASLALAAPHAPKSGFKQFATPHHPTGEYTQFADCPLNRATISDCIYGVTNSGSIRFGQKTLLIVNPIIIRGGFEGAGEEIDFFGAEDGNTMSRSPQPVPGGLLGVTPPASWPNALKAKFKQLIRNGRTGMTATAELAAPGTSISLSTENSLFEEGTALGLPVKFKIDNQLLGSNCYIGSSSSPIQLDLTTGATAPPPPNEPIHGLAGELTFNEAFTVITGIGQRLVNNSFAAPKARGCGGRYSRFIDPLVDSILGTPSPAGRNAVIMEGTFQDGQSSAVKESEE